MAEIQTIFCDIGGVILTNGWDHVSREAAANHFGLDWPSFEARHQANVELFDSGRMSLENYLTATAFNETRPFSRDEFRQFMYAQSQVLPGRRELFSKISWARKPFMIALNNESIELNAHRITTFKLRELFPMFVSSCYVHLRKPQPDIYKLALQLAQVPAGNALFIDDREENILPAKSLGMHIIHARETEQIATELAHLGIAGA